MSNQHPGRTLPYSVLDVFADAPLQGNPLAVFADGSTLSDTEMQAIAREMNLSETTFVLPRDAETERLDGVRVRIFTTREELRFAGHPTLGTATWLHLHHPALKGAATVQLALAAGHVPVTFEGALSPEAGVFGTMRQLDPEFGETLDRAPTAAALGLLTEDLDPEIAPQIVSTGTPFAIVPLRSLQALARLRVDHERAHEMLAPWATRWFFCVAPSADRDVFRARMQFHGGEDPATGSAAGCAIALLVRSGRVASGHAVNISQGSEIERPSLLRVRASWTGKQVHDVLVGGRTIPVATGRLFLP